MKYFPGSLPHRGLLCPLFPKPAVPTYMLHTSFHETLMPFSICFVSLLKKPSTIFSQEPWVGVNTNSNLPGTVLRYSCVSLEVWAEWLSSIRRILSPAGYFSSSIFRKRTKSERLFVIALINIVSGNKIENPLLRFSVNCHITLK